MWKNSEFEQFLHLNNYKFIFLCQHKKSHEQKKSMNIKIIEEGKNIKIIIVDFSRKIGNILKLKNRKENEKRNIRKIIKRKKKI